DGGKMLFGGQPAWPETNPRVARRDAQLREQLRRSFHQAKVSSWGGTAPSPLGCSPPSSSSTSRKAATVSSICARETISGGAKRTTVWWVSLVRKPRRN